MTGRPPPDENERRPGKGGAHEAQGGGFNASITAARTPVPQWRGCPCGCTSQPPWVDDPDCVRHQPVPAAVDWPTYSVVTLGLAAHDRSRCRSCRAAGR